MAWFRSRLTLRLRQRQLAILAVLLRKVLQMNMPASMAAVKIRASALKSALANAGPGQ
jgi:hypothetical protein